ncbi:MAG TPA: hypothetical protein VN605_05815, partial [Thermoanaerobaculia bacterium]|nr:hypothetical protein [Thermoanaerobaculia bacterium]
MLLMRRAFSDGGLRVMAAGASEAVRLLVIASAVATTVSILCLGLTFRGTRHPPRVNWWFEGVALVILGGFLAATAHFAH